MAKRKADDAPWKRQGSHRLECEGCPAYVYGTVACLLAYGLPCCACGAQFTPSRVELAHELGMTRETSLLVRAYEDELARISVGQAPHIAQRHNVQCPEELALSRFAAEYRRTARRRRFTAQDALPF